MNATLPDYHLHTTLCNHACGTMEEYVERAIELGFEEIGFAEHMPVMPEPHLCMTWEDLPLYVDRVKRLQDDNSGRIAIRLGAEMDMDLSRVDEISDIINRYPFDYVIGSVHYLEGWPFDQEQYADRFDGTDLSELYGIFFEKLADAARTGLYDIAGHIDNLKRMGCHLPDTQGGIVEDVARVFAEMNVAVEVNTSGYDHPVAEAYPSLWIIKVLNRYDIPVTVGSDAHQPEQVGRHFDRAAGVLGQAGYHQIAYFRGRQRLLKPIFSSEEKSGA
ncbi:histidinol-phosphatase HisJ family protein [Candidatus Latescibacterota bacterium]